MTRTDLREVECRECGGLSRTGWDLALWLRPRCGWCGSFDLVAWNDEGTARIVPDDDGGWITEAEAARRRVEVKRRIRRALAAQGFDLEAEGVEIR